MILALRQRHRRMFVTLAVLLPVAFAFGIAARRTVPQIGSLPPEFSSGTQRFTATGYQRDDLFARVPVEVGLWRERGTGRSAVGFHAPDDFLKPDLLVYWCIAHPTPGDALPPDARLLGAFAAGPLALPDDASASEGRLILFSLADQEIVDVSKPFVAANVSSRRTSPPQAPPEDGRRLTSAATED